MLQIIALADTLVYRLQKRRTKIKQTEKNDKITLVFKTESQRSKKNHENPQDREEIVSEIC